MDLNSNRSKGINAFIAPVKSYSGEVEMDRIIYPSPKPGQENAAHRGKFFKGEVDESKLPDGWYFYKEARFQSTKSASGVVEIKAGEVVQEVGTIDEMKINVCRKQFPGLPSLIGSSRQIEWAESLRASYLLQLWELGLSDGGESPSAIALQQSPKDAKWWIEAGGYASIRDWVKEVV